MNERRELLRAEPFKPFRNRLTSKDACEVIDPNSIGRPPSPADEENGIVSADMILAETGLPANNKPPRAAGAGRVWLCTTAASFVLFAATTAPDVLMMDSGEYQCAAYRFPHLNLGDNPADLVRVHPAYLAAAKLAGCLPIGNFARRINVLSAVFGAIVVGNAASLAFAASGSLFAALLATLVLMFGHTLWAFAVIAEVMTMVAALATTELLCWWKYGQSRQPRWLLLLAAVNGLGVAVHLQLGLDTFVHVAALLWLARRRQVSVTFLAAWALAWIAATLPYSGLVAYHGFHGGDWAATLRSATRGRFGATPMMVRPGTLLRGLESMLLNYPTLLVVLAIPGIGWLRRAGRSVSAGVWIGMAAVQWLFAMTYRVPDQYSFFVPFYALVAPLIGLGAVRLAERRAWRIALPALAIAPVGVYAAAAPLLRSAHVRFFTRALPYRDPYDFFLKPWKCGDNGQRRYVTELYEQLPPAAVVFTSYTMQFMLEYAQRVDGLRRDVRLVDRPADLAAYLETRPDGAGSWSALVFALDVEAKDFPPPLREQCGLEKTGLAWRLGPPGDSARLREMLLAGP